MYYKRILDALPELIYVTSQDGVTPIFFNKAWYDYTGLTDKDVDMGWQSIIDPQETERVLSTIEKAVEKQEPYTVEVRLKCCDGDYRWFLSKATPIFDADGSVDSYVGMSVDINASKLSAFDMEQRYERILEARLSKIKELEQELELHQTT